MKKLIFLTSVLFAVNAFAQNIALTNLFEGNGNEQRFVQSQQVFASNIVSNNNSNKPVRVNANPQVQVQRASTSNANSNARRQARRVTTVSNPVQTNIINVNENSTDEIQQLLTNVQDNNVGNAFGNESLMEQIASANIPAIQVGTGSLNLNLEMPAIKLPSMKFTSRKTVSSSSHKKFHLKNKMAKLDRKMGKFSLKKKMRIKVDNCFKF